MNEKLVIATAIALPIVYGITKVTKTLACAKAYAQVVARMDTLRDLDKKNGSDCLNTTRSSQLLRTRV
jgi:hypothetical protein